MGADRLMSKTDDELQRQIREHNANTLKFFDDAKKIQQGVSKLPFADRQAAMNKVGALETVAVAESLKVIILEAEQASIQSDKARWQNRT